MFYETDIEIVKNTVIKNATITIHNKERNYERFPRDCDIIKITHIVLDTTPDNLTFGDKVVINIGSQIVYKCNLKYHYLINNCKEENGKFIIPIYIPTIYTMLLTFHEVGYSISINKNFNNIELLCEKRLFNGIIYKYCIDNINSTDKIIIPCFFTKANNTNKVNFILNNDFWIDEYIMQCNTNNIKNLEIYFYEKKAKKLEILNYDSEKIKNNLVKNDNLIKIPIDIKKILDEVLKHYNRFPEKLICPYSKIGFFIIKIDFYEEEKEINLFGNTFNYLRYQTGMGGIRYSVDINDTFLDMTYSNYCSMINNNNFQKTFLDFNDNLGEGKTIYYTENIEEIKNVNYDNFDENLLELKIFNPEKNLTNLPITLEKLVFFNKINDINIKIPFGCEYIEEKLIFL
jgi:hypothetical protein